LTLRAGRPRWAGRTLRACCASRTRRSRCTCGSGRSSCTLGTCGPRCTSQSRCALRPGRACRPCQSHWTLWAGCANRPCGTCGAREPDGALRTSRSCCADVSYRSDCSLLRQHRPVAGAIRNIRIRLMSGIPGHQRNVSGALKENAVADRIGCLDIPRSAKTDRRTLRAYRSCRAGWSNVTGCTGRTCRT